MRSITEQAKIGAQVGMGAMLTHQAARGPDRPALTIGERILTYGELESGANRRAPVFSARETQKDDLIAIGVRDGFEFHEASFAVWKIGATPAPISHRLVESELGVILELMNPRVTLGVVTEQHNAAATFPAVWTPEVSTSYDPLADRTASYWKANTYGLMLDDTVLMPAPLYHSAPFSFTNLALCWGAHVIEMQQFDPLETLRLIEKHHISWLYLVPNMMSQIWLLPEEVRTRYDLSLLEMMLRVTAPCAIWLKQAWIDWLSPEKIWETYGGTVAVGGTVISGRERLDPKGSVGRSYLGKPSILDDCGRQCVFGEVGNICFLSTGGQQSTLHYLGAQPQEQNGWDSYGDLGWLDADGYLYIANRRTDMILTGDTNIYPAETEAAIEEHPAVSSYVCVGLADSDLGQRLQTILELRNGCDVAEADDLEEFLTQRLVRFKWPYSYEVSLKPLRDEAGKVRRSALLDERLELQRQRVTFKSFQRGRTMVS